MTFHDDNVLSEVHVSSNFLECEDGYITRFPIHFPCKETVKRLCSVMENDKNAPILFDEDGDICRPNVENNDNKLVLTIKHHHATPLSSVGKQVWMGSLVMADYILYSDEFSDSYCIELGCGLGLCSIISQIKIQHMICTDFENDVLNLCYENIDVNSLINDVSPQKSIIDVKQLDWSLFDDTSITPTSLLQDDKPETINMKFQWSLYDISLLKKTDIIFAADCIYDESLTQQLFNTIQFLLHQSKQKRIDVFISLEKRLNFSMTEMDVAAPSYEHFMRILDFVKSGEYFTNLIGTFVVEEIPVQFPKYFDYERNKYLELWRITYLQTLES